MALIMCEECGKEVSDKAAACPHCGAPVAVKPAVAVDVPTSPTKDDPRKEINLWIWIPLGLVVAFFVLGSVVGNSPEAKEKSRQRSAINLCWDDQSRKSNSAGQSQFIAGACERMESEYVRKHGTRP